MIYEFTENTLEKCKNVPVIKKYACIFFAIILKIITFGSVNVESIKIANHNNYLI